MSITRLQFWSTLVIAMLLHGALAAWVAMPDPDPPPVIETPPLQTIKLSLLTKVAEETVPASAPTPPVRPKPKPRSQPTPEPQPEVQEPKSDPAPEPLPEKQEPQPMPQKPVLPHVTDITAPPDAASTIRYEQLLVAWLQKHKKYPRRAKRLRIEGRAQLRIRIDQSGHTQHIILAQRTGNRMLDQAALDMAHRSDPFPPFPDGDQRTTLEFVVPVEFALR